MSNWTLWENGTKRENKAADELGFRYKKDSARGYKIRYWTSRVHRSSTRKDNDRRTLAKVDEFVRARVTEYLNNEQVAPKAAKEHESDELAAIKQVLKDHGIKTPAYVFVKEMAAKEALHSKCEAIEIKAAIKKYVSEREKTMAYESLPGLKKTLHDVFSPFYGGLLSRLHPNDLVAHYDKLWDKEGWSTETYNKRIAGGRKFLQWAKDKTPGYLHNEWPTNKLVRKKEKSTTKFKHGMTLYFTPDQASDILDSATGHNTRLNQYDYAPLLGLQFFGAARPFETYQQPMENFNMEDDTITLAKNKFGGKIRHVPLKPNLKKLILPYWEKQGGKGLMLPDDMRVKIEPLYYALCEEVKIHREIISEDKLAKYNVLSKSIGYTCSQAYGRIAKRLNIDWIRDGCRHSYGTFRYRELFDIMRDKESMETPKSTLQAEMGTGLDMLDNHYIGARGVDSKTVKQYFEVGL